MSLKGRFGAVGEKLTHRAPGPPGFEAASPHICGGKASFGTASPEPHSSGSRLALGLPFLCHCSLVGSRLARHALIRKLVSPVLHIFLMQL